MRQAFSLVELLIVVAIIVLAMGMTFAIPKGDLRFAQVKGAADELAATMRLARNLAIDKKAAYALAFNIQNAPGSSGLVLNNRSGGHWYRILGPHEDNWDMGNNGSPTYPLPSRDYNGTGPGHDDSAPGWKERPVHQFLGDVNRAWSGDKHVLPPGKVRFLALNDQDDGGYRGQGDTYPATYPRPWFGFWDATNQRLRGWGGYDPTLQMVAPTGDGIQEYQPRTRQGKVISHSGFYYEGDDGLITGSVNPRDRDIYMDSNADGWIYHTAINKPTLVDDVNAKYRLLTKGQPRPVVNAEWLDYYLIFRPDGSVSDSAFMELRHWWGRNIDGGWWTKLFRDPFNAVKGTQSEVAMGDMCNQYFGWLISWLKENHEAVSFEPRTGYFLITLAPDAPSDDDVFPTAEMALRSMTPMFRVGISRLGEVKIIQVGNRVPSGKTFDTNLSGTKWNSKSDTDKYVRRKMVTKLNSNLPNGPPVTDFVTAEMLRDRTWWLNP